MRRKLLRVGRAWRLLVAPILALCLVLIGSAPVAALSVTDYCTYSWGVEFSQTEINGSELFNATITVTATRNNNDFPLNLSPSEASFIGRIIAEHEATGAEVTLNSNYTVEISPFPQKDETTQSSVVVSLQFPEGSQSGTYTVVGELIEAKIKVIIWWDVTSYLSSSQVMGSVTYTAPRVGGGGGGGISPPTGEEVTTNLFGAEASSPISSTGEILETIEATSEDGTLTLTIPAGTIALDKEDNPLISLEAEVDTNPPPPEDTSIIGLAYDFSPDEATFDPPITLTWSYDPNDIPEGVAEEDLVLAWYDEATNQWVELDGVVDTSNNTIMASIKHFTTFAIIGVVMSAPESESEVSVAVFRISELDISPGEADIGQTVTINVLVTNSGNLEGTYQVTLEIDNKVVETQEVTLAGGARDIVTFKISENIASIYSVNINGLAGSFIVKPVATSEPELAPISTPPATHTPPSVTPISWPVVYGVVVALVAMGALLFFLVRRSHTKSSS